MYTQQTSTREKERERDTGWEEMDTEWKYPWRIIQVYFIIFVSLACSLSAQMEMIVW